MKIIGKVQGASAFTHALKEYGGGKSMAEGVKRIAKENRQQGFQQGVNFALQRLSLAERLLGRQMKHK